MSEGHTGQATGGGGGNGEGRGAVRGVGIK